jgi:hypothetical protein
MKLRAVVALLFLAAQFAHGLHAAIEAGHDVHACRAEGTTPRLDTCDPDHDASQCPVCATSRAHAAVTLEAGGKMVEREAIPAPPVPDLPSADPFHVDTPDTRGPPA